MVKPFLYIASIELFQLIKSMVFHGKIISNAFYKIVSNSFLW